RVEILTAITAISCAQNAGPTQQKSAVQERAHRGALPIGDLNLSFPVAQPRPDNAYLGMRVGESDQPRQGAMGNHGIVVEEKEVAAAGTPGRLVVGPGKSQVCGVVLEDHLRKFLSDHVRGAVRRGV